MPTVTRPRPKLVSKHLSPPTVEPINAGQVKGHYIEGKKAGSAHWVMWCIMILMLAMGAAGYHWASKMLRAANNASAVIALCSLGSIGEPKILCEPEDLDCMTNPTTQEVAKMQEAIRVRNEEFARACIRVM